MKISPETVSISTAPWKEYPLKVRTSATITLEEDGFAASFVIEESNPKREYTEHFSPVHMDSCVEWFVNFYPEKCDRYFNFEVNPNGAMNVSFRKDRFNEQKLTAEEVNSFGIKTEIFADRWTASYKIPFAFIEKYIPGFTLRKGLTLKTNFYKCAEGAENIHFLVWNNVETEKPDYHRPEFFGELTVE